ncbi:MAG: DUF342 domain-containing protein [Firmicutes bacterium HGW-Firmicutes-1]|nr:MAG: DUF342 domain-containing protein [Firmicutes bacterium HGW-Firmicutes-1]
MFENIIFANDFIQIILEEEQIFIKVLKKDYPIQALNEILIEFPRISITNFVALKSALMNCLSSPIKIGELKPKLELLVSSDKMLAQGYIRLTQNEFNECNKKQLVGEIIDLAVNKEISFGIDIQRVIDDLKPMEKFDVAIGTVPIPGEDASVTMYEVKKTEPLLYQDGKVNHYELNLINKIEKGDWLGERIDPKDGVSGTNIFGEEIEATLGRQEKLRYDKATVDAIYDIDKGITTLIAKRTGAVVYDQDAISVSNFIEITGDVSFNTGNIDFDGFVDIKKSVDDNFSVRAINDIQILGDMGVGGVDFIESKQGNIYIRGGIAGKNKARIICRGDLYTKFAADCTIECEGTVNIGYYAMNCNIIAKEVILESAASKIIGGNIEAMVKVEVGELGSKAGVPTRILIHGFNRTKLKEEYDLMGLSIERTKEKIEALKKSLSRFKGEAINVEEQTKYEALEKEYLDAKNSLTTLYDQRKRYISYLHAKGEGEVKVKRIIYPGAVIRMREEVLHIREVRTIQTSYYIDEGQIKED